MIIVRMVFEALPGHGEELALLLRRDVRLVMGDLSKGAGWRALAGGFWRVLLSESGPLEMVVLELEVRDLAAWERFKPEMFASPHFGPHFAQMQTITTGGHAEFYRLITEG